jgi:hypothetical protein
VRGWGVSLDVVDHARDKTEAPQHFKIEALISPPRLRATQQFSQGQAVTVAFGGESTLAEFIGKEENRRKADIRRSKIMPFTHCCWHNKLVYSRRGRDVLGHL